MSELFGKYFKLQHNLYGRLFPPADEKAPFQAAQDKCQEGNPKGNLVSIHSERDNNIIKYVTEHDVWIGLKINSKDNYEWLDGSPVDYQVWKDGGKILL